MTVPGHGSIRATDADREAVHAELRAAYSDGRLTYEEFDARASAALTAKTYGELTPLTADLRLPVSQTAVPYRPGAPAAAGTNPLAIVSLLFGIGQIFLPMIGGVIAIAAGHVARSQTSKSGEAGSGLALAGLSLGYLGVVGPLVIVLFLVLR